MLAAIPASCTGTELTAALSITPNADPTPSPKTTRGAATSHQAWPGSSVTSQNDPAAISRELIVNMIRARTRPANWPMRIGRTNTGAISGSRRSPAALGE